MALITKGTLKTLLDGATATGAGSINGTSPGVSTFQAYGTTSSGTGAAQIDIQVSNDGNNWLTAGTITLSLATTATTDGFVTDMAWQYVRGYVQSISGTGAAVTVTMGV